MHRINHIGLVVSDIDKAVKPYEEIFNIKKENQMIMEKYEVKIAFLEFENIKLEFIQPLSNHGDFFEFLENDGGLHHFAIEVKDLSTTLKKIKSKKIKMKDDKPKQGAADSLVAFSERESFDGVLIEFKQLSI